jgi:ubiquinol-cytochrome c reductase iron-sulfur subunit
VIAKKLVVSEDVEEDYWPEAHPAEQDEVMEIVEESGSRFTRKRLVTLAGAAAGTALAAALAAPAVSLGPVIDMDSLYRTPWRRGRRLLDEAGKPLTATEIERDVFYTAFPEGADRELIGSPLVVVRLDPGELELPPGRDGWAPEGILAYSKVCTHAACAIALYRKPLFPPAHEPRPALICPCHYSTFDPARGGAVLYGPAGRPLPQLPLVVENGELRAGGNFSGPVGPSWWGVRMGEAKP